MDPAEWSIDRSGLLDEDFERLREKWDPKALKGGAILLTGATGFFGLWLVEFLDWLRRSEGLNVTAYVLSRDPEFVADRHPVYRQRSWIRFLRGDVRSFELPPAPIDYIVHGATDTSAAAGRDGVDLLDVSYAGTRRILDFAGRSGCRRVLMISSGAIYGPAPHPCKFSESDNSAPDTMLASSAYAEGKRVSEALGTLMSQNAAFDVVTARCFAFVGAGLPLGGHFAVGNFIRDALDDRDMHLNSTGRSARSYLYAGDLVVWLMTLLAKGRPNAAYNVGSDLEIDVRSVAERVRNALRPGRVVRIAENPSTGISYYVPNIERARSELGLDVWTDLDLAIRRTAADAQRFGPFRGQR